MKLKLLNPDLAAVFGMPLNDCDSEQIIKELIERGWSEQDARTHVSYSIERGAYEPMHRIERAEHKREA